MNNHMLHYFKYPGVHKYFVDIFNNLTKDIKAANYYELFAGSGIIYMNDVRSYDHVVLNDLDKYVIRVHKSFRDGTFEDYKKCVGLSEDCGDIKQKDSYLKFRSYYNSLWFNTDTLEEGFLIHILVGSCLQGLFRFSKNGFNMTFGQRTKILDEHTFEAVKARLCGVCLECRDFTEINILPNSLVFLDPPYIATQNDLYNKKWNVDKFDELTKLMGRINNNGSYFVYTDVLCEINSTLPYTKTKIERKFLNNKPYNTDDTKNRVTDKEEYFWTNIPVENDGMW